MCFDNLQGHGLTDDEIAELVKEFDSNGDGEIDFSEFCTMVERREKADALREAFAVRASPVGRSHPLYMHMRGLAFSPAACLLGVPDCAFPRFPAQSPPSPPVGHRRQQGRVHR